MSGTLVPMGTGVPAGTHQNFKNLGYRWVPGTEESSEIVYRWVPGTEKISEVGYRFFLFLKCSQKIYVHGDNYRNDS